MTIRNSQKSGPVTVRTHGCLLGFGLFWTAFSLFFLFLMLGNEPNVFGVLFISLFILIGLGMTGFGLMSYYTRFKVGKPEFVLSQTELRVGEEFNFSFQHTFPRSVHINWMKTRLIFRETATYQQGTDTTTVTHDHVMDEYEEPGADFKAGHMIGKAYSFQIPPDAMHTLKVKRNNLQWFLYFEADISSLPNFVEQFELTVLPEMKPYG